MSTLYRDFTTPIAALGAMRIACHGEALTRCDFIDSLNVPAPTGWQWSDNNELLNACQQALEIYFRTGKLHFNFALAPEGTEFQRQVWDALLEIPLGGTCSYSDIAHRIGRPTAVRAVAGAIGRNPVGILIPCHRVIGRDGSLTGYASGLQRKTALLEREGVL